MNAVELEIKGDLAVAKERLERDAEVKIQRANELNRLQANVTSAEEQLRALDSRVEQAQVRINQLESALLTLATQVGPTYGGNSTAYQTAEAYTT